VPPSYVAISTTLKAIGDDQGARYSVVQRLKELSARCDATPHGVIILSAEDEPSCGGALQVRRFAG